MDNQETFIALYDSHILAEDAVKKFQQAGYDMKKLSIVGQDYRTEENVVGFYNLGDRVRKWGSGGAFWGSIWGLLLGSAFFIIPGIGPVFIAGPLIAALVGALEGAIVLGGISALGAALYSLGIPKNSIVQYETEIKAGKFMLVAHGTAYEVTKAREILGSLVND
ncbi:general stress protein [Spirosoma spitsbergense]|uniref:general stress protein n=1 Tax=Spirosoma spitsbergense TaxID=431554 RepID=UPI000376407B|nr:general stress protein [Spirosoma spitsbergense]